MKVNFGRWFRGRAEDGRGVVVLDETPSAGEASGDSHGGGAAERPATELEIGGVWPGDRARAADARRRGLSMRAAFDEQLQAMRNALAATALAGDDLPPEQLDAVDDLWDWLGAVEHRLEKGGGSRLDAAARVAEAKPELRARALAGFRLLTDKPGAEPAPDPAPIAAGPTPGRPRVSLATPATAENLRAEFDEPGLKLDPSFALEALGDGLSLAQCHVRMWSKLAPEIASQRMRPWGDECRATETARFEKLEAELAAAPLHDALTATMARLLGIDDATALEHLASGATIEEAIRGETKRLRQTALGLAKLGNAGRGGAEPVSAGRPQGPGAAGAGAGGEDEYGAMVRRVAREKSISIAAATDEVNRTHPQLRAAYVRRDPAVPERPQSSP